jgi:thiamine-phosphate pyrophosphorylase
LFLYYITDRRQLASDERRSRQLLLEQIGRAAEAGINAIQLREKDLSARQLLELAVEAVKVVRERSQSTKFLINSRMDIALACGADGVHLPSDDISASEARAMLTQAGMSRAVIAASCHDVREVELAEGHGADFGVFAPVFEKDGLPKSDGLPLLQGACRERRVANPRMPVLALGGVTLHNAEQCVAVGADGIAAIRLFQIGDIGETVRRLRSLQALPRNTA